MEKNDTDYKRSTWKMYAIFFEMSEMCHSSFKNNASSICGPISSCAARTLKSVQEAKMSCFVLNPQERLQTQEVGHPTARSQGYFRKPQQVQEVTRSSPRKCLSVFCTWSGSELLTNWKTPSISFDTKRYDNTINNKIMSSRFQWGDSYSLRGRRPNQLLPHGNREPII